MLGSLLLGTVVRATDARSAEGDGFRLVVVPDTQVYAQSSAGGAIAQAQFDWIAADADRSNTVFVTHVGDVVQNPNSTTEWDRLEPGFAALEAVGLPYAMAPGNHDLVDGGGPVEYDTRFPAGRFANEDWFGGSHEAEGNRSSWQTVSVTGHDLLFVHVRHVQDTYGPTGPLLAWLDGVLAAHPDHLAIVTTHEFTEDDGTVRIPAVREVLDGHCNVAAVFSGHRPGEAARGTFTDACGRQVHHILTNYQFIADGGDGYLRTLDIDPYTLAASSAVYSPTLDTARSGTDEAFTIALSKLIDVGGDANCDRGANIIDALVIAQFSVGNRSDQASCPLPDPTTQVNASAADVDGSGMIDVVDALLIAQCDVGIPNGGCP